MLKKYSTLALFAALMLAFASCKKESNDKPTENENEEISTVKLTFVNDADANDKVIATWRSIDGNVTIDSVKLKLNTTYTVNTDFIDENASPADTITNEIREESDEHHVFHLIFTQADASIADALTTVATITPLDKDENNLPVGLEYSVSTKEAFTGFYRVIVRHQPDGAKDGTFAPGSTDVDTEFPLVIK
ncbi:hypothetical protein COR50_01625 [Chitinophaga caeni]|uniref:Type 1 periplasmic binding fold superfamily protein n=1 Tax=Chitinophaga caeni TaxID=2029983 RepID=A0A291QQ46_9BACT|nr:hypothetical protein [Chitinophaga caeni]ATL45964.1 hypothetical protein COR50_01625 [Chitinophaga caeni]